MGKVARETAPLESVGKAIRKRLGAMHEAREKVFESSRDCILHCANAIRAAHRGEFELSKERIASARLLLAEMDKALDGHENVRYTGFFHDAQKEYAEAAITLAMVSGKPVPAPEDLSVTDQAYLNGLGEAAGEMRRHVLDVIRTGDISRCEEIMAMLDDIYAVLVTIDLPDSITGGLKRTSDMVRGVLERTRGDLTLSLRQERLEEMLRRVEQRMEGGQQA